MPIDTNRHVTADGHDFRVIADDLGGDEPYAIFVNGEVARLDRNLRCAGNPGYSLSERRQSNTRYFNVYRAADGGFCFGSRAFKSNDDRLETDDSDRALFGLKVTFEEATGSVQAQRV
jgi:hypothetical protein